MVHDINLFPWREFEQARYRRRFYLMALVMALLSGIALRLGGAYLETQQQHQQRRMTLLHQQQEVLARHHHQWLDTREKFNALAQRQAILTAIQTKRNRTTNLLNALPGWIPDGVYLDTLTLNGQRVRLSGVGDNTATLTRLLANLEQARQVSGINMHSVIQGVARFERPFAQFELSFSLLEEAPLVNEND
ncbi:MULTISPECIES: PilN domain-containing protein [unclassified Vibrio]|uniref:PilN domain-containing protein n=1 Tax=unclassified Vibrio TaxID=2614977 RepID=UPI001360BA3B|nr:MULTISPECIES: PilN domain-containing protein [unclassified Vibrio]NAW59220.1 pilus assembly protein PilN [Vibrio sp. V36_P2S2PM302]NAX26132.1 pilus assembly protein PilN [Vibrio sp. V38_P2S17PM301]NAX28821.1 pilus assembly protein PilN [Vibrio sp. V37_P2S8PM304]